MKRLLGYAMLLFNLFFVACGPHFDQESADHFTELKAYHINFVDRFTGVTGRTYDDAALTSACNQGAREFDNAKAYMESEGDKQRLKALAYLREQFNKDCSFLRSVEKLYSKSYADERKAALRMNYDHAIAAEYGVVGDHE
jgi:hypothetical protein